MVLHGDEETKTGTPHVVLLARQAVAILREVHSLTGHGRYVFPNARYPHRERPMSHATLWNTFWALDIPRDRMTLHGFRAMARTILDEVLGFRPDFIEHQLAHAVRDSNGRAYNAGHRRANDTGSTEGHAIPAGLATDIAAMLFAVWVVRLLFG